MHPYLSKTANLRRFFDEITSELSENRLSSDGNRGWGKEKGHGGTGTDDSLNGGVKDVRLAVAHVSKGTSNRLNGVNFHQG